MKLKLRLELLRPGDIILIGYNDRRARVIQGKTNSKYSHAMLVWYDSIIHAADLVITENPSRLLFDTDEAVCILRLKEQPGNEIKIKLLIEYARQFVGTLYDTDALKSLIRGNTPAYNVNRQMCSKFVAQCYEYVYSDLVDDYETCSPQDLYESNMVEIIEDVLTEANEWDVMYAESPNVTKLQYDAILTFIKELYKIHPEADIMSLMQLETYIEQHPEESDSITELLLSTDYFNLWAKEAECCPYLYDKQKFKEFWKDSQIQQALNIQESSTRIISEKKAEIGYYLNQIQKMGDLKYYHYMLDLNNNIISNAYKRIEIAERVLLDNKIVKIKLPK